MCNRINWRGIDERDRCRPRVEWRLKNGFRSEVILTSLARQTPRFFPRRASIGTYRVRHGGCDCSAFRSIMGDGLRGANTLAIQLLKQYSKLF
jgi:hypothetical protein